MLRPAWSQAAAGGRAQSAQHSLLSGWPALLRCRVSEPTQQWSYSLKVDGVSLTLAGTSMCMELTDNDQLTGACSCWPPPHSPLLRPSPSLLRTVLRLLPAT